MNGHECYIIGAGDFFGLREMPDDSDYVIAADAGFEYCCKTALSPTWCSVILTRSGKLPSTRTLCSFPLKRTIRILCLP